MLEMCDLLLAHASDQSVLAPDPSSKRLPNGG